MDDFLSAGYRVLRFDNRGIGASSKPAGPYSSRMLADDAKALVDSLGITGFHLMGVSMGGMIAQEYALAYPGDLRSVAFACTYAAPGPFCSRMFAMWADMAPVLGVPFVMRDVTLWAFTVPFFEQRTAELAEFETEMRFLDLPRASSTRWCSAPSGRGPWSRLRRCLRAAKTRFPTRCRCPADRDPNRPRIGQAGASRLATWRNSGEPIEDCTLRANSQSLTRPWSSPASPAIRSASEVGSAASLSSQLSMCCRTS